MGGAHGRFGGGKPAVTASLKKYPPTYGATQPVSTGTAASLTSNMKSTVRPAYLDTFSIAAPSDPNLPGGGGYTVSGLYNLKPASFGRPSDNYVTFADNYGKAINHWNGFDLTFNARAISGLTLQGGTSTGRTSTDNCEVAAKLPEMQFGAPNVGDVNANVWQPAAYCHQVGHFLTQAKLIGTYLIPRLDVQVAATVQSLPGPQVIANLPATNAIVAPSLGRPLSGGAANMVV